MNYRFIKKISTILLIILGLFLNSSFVYAEDLVVKLKRTYVSTSPFNYAVGCVADKRISETVSVDYDNALEKMLKEYDLLYKNMNSNGYGGIVANPSECVITYHILDIHYSDLHPIIDNELTLHPDSLGLIMAHDQISPLEWEDKVKKLSAKGIDHLSYAEKFDLTLCLEYYDPRVSRSEPLSERLKKADEILAALWKEDNQLIVWYTRFGLYNEDEFRRLGNGEPELETTQESIKKKSALDDDLIAFAAGDTILKSTRKAQANGWKDGPISTYNLSKSQLKYLLQAVNNKAGLARPRELGRMGKPYSHINELGDAAEYAYWQRWIKQIEAQLKEANAAK
jgi:hypothetical protein